MVQIWRKVGFTHHAFFGVFGRFGAHLAIHFLHTLFNGLCPWGYLADPLAWFQLARGRLHFPPFSQKFFRIASHRSASQRIASLGLLGKGKGGKAEEKEETEDDDERQKSETPRSTRSRVLRKLSSERVFVLNPHWRLAQRAVTLPSGV